MPLPLPSLIFRLSNRPPHRQVFDDPLNESTHYERFVDDPSTIRPPGFFSFYRMRLTRKGKDGEGYSSSSSSSSSEISSSSDSSSSSSSPAPFISSSTSCTSSRTCSRLKTGLSMSEMRSPTSSHLCCNSSNMSCNSAFVGPDTGISVCPLLPCYRLNFGGSGQPDESTAPQQRPQHTASKPLFSEPE